MRFVHADPEWAQLLDIVAREVDRDVALVEKDYWVTHTLWALVQQGFEVWFKGGTSLSKGFELIERFSEDIDVRVDAGRSGLAEPPTSWKNTKAGAVRARQAWFDAIANHLEVHACEVWRDPAASDAKARGAAFQVRYPAQHVDKLPPAMRPFVLLEIGRARVTPFVQVDLSSWVHDHLERTGEFDAFLDNRPKQLRCIHPWVTCLEKLDAIAVRFDKGKPAHDFVRHYEDAARILAHSTHLPPLPGGLPALLDALASEDRKSMPIPAHPSLQPNDSKQWAELRAAWIAIEPLFWGERVRLDDACATIRAFLATLSDGHDAEAP